MAQTIVGLFLIAIGWTNRDNPFSVVLFIQGMIMVNLGLHKKYGNNKSLERL